MRAYFPAMGVDVRFALLSILVALPFTGSAQQEFNSDGGALAPVVRKAFEMGFGGPLGGRVCTALGITRNDEPLPVEQISVGGAGDGRTFNVSRHRGALDIIVTVKRKEGTTIFLASKNGGLIKAVAQRGGEKSGTYSEIPLAEAKAPFEEQTNWWLNVWLKAHSSAAHR